MSAKKTNLVLIGMPGSGKSTLGKKLARDLSLDFLDIDKLIEQRESMTVQQVIDLHDADYFRLVEETILCGLSVQHHLLATGGSAVLSDVSMQHLSLSSKLIYLRISLATLLQRVDNEQTRGLVKKSSDSLADLYHRRLPIYDRWADLVIDNDLRLNDLRYSEILKTISGIKDE